jgi:Ni,Fe-hydrogenase III large subunit/Ni,Fe-hydrogenase III component G
MPQRPVPVDQSPHAPVACVGARLAETCAALAAGGARLLTLFGADERVDAGEFAIYAAFLAPGGQTLSVRASVDAQQPEYPSVTPVVQAVHWDERELADLLGIQPMGHPDPRPLVRRPDWPAGVFPLRKDFDPVVFPPTPRELESFVPRPVEGDGVVEVPVGPIHAGVIEPGHFHFAAIGELVLQLEARLFYTHRGIEKLAEGRTADQALPLAERLCGACALSHATAFCQAIESLADAEIPPRASWARTVLLEVERLYNHLGDAGNICAGTGFAVGAMQGGLLKERLQQLNEHLVGHRFLRGVCTPGGLRRDLDKGELLAARLELEQLHLATRTFTHLLVEHDGFMDRLRGTGRLESGTVRALGGVGPAARASGVDTDLRRDRPYAAYKDVRHALHVPVHHDGDVEARLRQRLAEAIVSFRLLDELLANPPDGPVRIPLGPLQPHRLGLGVVESPRGADVHAVLLDGDGRIARYRARSASFPNWPLVPLAVPGNLMPDFPLINKSFELCYACLDR